MTIDELASAEEIRIETRRPGGSPRKTIIWVVVDGARLFVRSVLGERGRWYQEACADPAVAVWLGEQRLACRARLVTDPAEIALVSARLAAKYPAGPDLESMLVAEVLPTTLELVPEAGAAS